ncbi:prohibitin family protein [bacterium]|nr:prohibitin family protein [bacterium]
MKRNVILVVIAAVVLIGAITGYGIKIVDTGHRGVKTRFGKVVGEPLDEGLYFYNPITTKIQDLEVRVLKLSGETQTYTKDVQQATIRYVINFALDKAHVHDVYQNLGLNWRERVIPQVIEGSLKAVIGKWDAVDLIGNRQKATVEAQEAIREGLRDKFIDVNRFEMTDISYEDAFEQAVERKVIAIQNASQAENKTKQIEEEAKQKVISAKAEAESMSIRARALTQNKSLVEYEAVQKWDGKLPQYMMGNSVPFINMK